MQSDAKRFFSNYLQTETSPVAFATKVLKKFFICEIYSLSAQPRSIIIWYHSALCSIGRRSMIMFQQMCSQDWRSNRKRKQENKEMLLISRTWRESSISKTEKWIIRQEQACILLGAIAWTLYRCSSEWTLSTLCQWHQTDW